MHPKLVRRPWEAPFHFWGSSWSTPYPKSFDDLVNGGLCSEKLAELISSLIDRRASVLVYSGTSGAGKSTLLHALLNELGVNRTIVFLRGCYEPFDFVDSTEADSTVLCINELSPHLPVYLWGTAARIAFELSNIGYQIAGTIHAGSAEDVVQRLSREPLRIPLEAIARPKILIHIDTGGTGDGTVREVRTVTALMPGVDERSLRRTILAERPLGSDEDRIDHHAVEVFKNALREQAN